MSLLLARKSIAVDFPHNMKVCNFPERQFGWRNDQVSTSWTYTQRQENCVRFEEKLASIMGCTKSHLTNLGKLIHANVCLGSRGLMLRLETLILQEPLWNNDSCTESYPKLKTRAMLPCHKFLLPDFSWCYFWRSCGVGNSEHPLIFRQRETSILWALASTIINQQSSPCRSWWMSHVDVLPCWEEDTKRSQWKWIHTELCQVFIWQPECIFFSTSPDAPFFLLSGILTDTGWDWHSFPNTLHLHVPGKFPCRIPSFSCKLHW